MGTTADKLAKLNETKADLKSALSEKGVTVGNVFSTYPDAVRSIPSGGKRTCRFVIGTSTAGWTENDCDYLCDGADDQAEINAAIAALPESGGEIVVLDGSYAITASSTVDKANLSLTGSGPATRLVFTKQSSLAPIFSLGHSAQISNLSLSYSGLLATNLLSFAYLALSQSGLQVTFRQCRIDASYSFASGSASTLLFEGCTFAAPEDWGDNSISFNKYAVFSHCSIQVPIRLGSGGGLFGCDLDMADSIDNQYAVEITDVSGRAEGCRIKGPFGISLTAPNCIVLGNRVELTPRNYDMPNTGIRLADNGSIISGNSVSFLASFPAGSKTIEIFGTSYSAGNIVTNNVLYGADVTDGGSQTVKANNSVISA